MFSVQVARSRFRIKPYIHALFVALSSPSGSVECASDQGDFSLDESEGGSSFSDTSLDIPVSKSPLPNQTKKSMDAPSSILSRMMQGAAEHTHRPNQLVDSIDFRALRRELEQLPSLSKFHGTFSITFDYLGKTEKVRP